MNVRFTHLLNAIVAFGCLPLMAQQGDYPSLQEDVSKRDAFTKHYELEDGKYQAYISGAPVHYLDENGVYQDINTSIIPSENGFVNNENIFQTQFPSNLNGQALVVRTESGEFKMGNASKIEFRDINGIVISTVASAEANEVVISDNKATYPLFENANSEYVVGNGELKNNIILSEMPTTIPGNAAYLTYTEMVELPSNMVLLNAGQYVTNGIVSGGLQVANQSGDVIVDIPVPDVYEQSDLSKTIHAEGIWNQSYAIEYLGEGRYSLSTLVPIEWLTEQGRNFPVVVDPTITVSGSFGGWLNSSNGYNDATYYVFTANNYSSNTYRAWTKWNISSIPTGSIVLNSELRMYCNGGVAGVDTINVNDVTGTYGNYGGFNSSAYTDLANGTYIQFTMNSVGTYYGFYDLGTTCDGDVEDQIGNTWFQLGFSMAPGTTNWKRFTATSSQLRIEYVQCTGQLGGSVTTSGLNSFGHHVDCYGDTTASITAVGSGGSNYTYSWTGPNGFTSTAGTINNLGAGEYTVVIYSGSICPATVDTTILSPDQLMINDSTSSFSGYGLPCFDGNDGAIYLSPTGSSGTYSYSWTGPNSYTSTSQNITGLERGYYYVTLTESNASCSIEDSVFLSSPLLLELVLDETSDAYCEFDENGSAEVHAVGGVQAYSYDWDNGETAATAVALAAGMRSVTVTDNNGCETDLDVEIGFEFHAPDVDLGGADTGYCKDGSVILNPGGGFASYLWNDGSTGQLLQVNAMGTYSVTCTTIGGCEGFDEINVNAEYDLPEPDLGANVNVPSGPVVLTPGVYESYVWSTGSLDSAINVNLAGTYTVTVTDDKACKGTDEVNVKFWTVGIEDDVDGGSFALYPNPASDFLTIESSANISLTSIELINTQGQLVKRSAVAPVSNRVNLDVSDLSSGVYIMNLSDGKSQWQSTFIKR